MTELGCRVGFIRLQGETHLNTISVDECDMTQILIIKQAAGHILAAGHFPHSEKSLFSFSTVFQRCCFLLGVPETRITGPIMLRAAPSCRAATLTGFKLVIRVFLFLVSGNMFLQRNVCPSHANGLHLTFDCTAFVFV